MHDDIKNKIANDKEVLSVLPQNNIRAKKKYREKVLEILDNYQKFDDRLYKEIEKRFQNLNNLQKDNLVKISDELTEYLLLFHPYISSMEILKIDSILDNISHFEESNLDNINNSIKEICNIFKKVGITLTTRDFSFNFYASNYIEELFKNEKDSEEILKYFETLYWKCPNILKYITFNLENLYYKNKKKFDKYINNEKDKVLAKYDNYEELLKQFQKIITDNDDLKQHSKERYVRKFKDGKLDLKDYQQEKMQKTIEELTENIIVSDKEKVFIDLLNTLKEYQQTIALKDFLDDFHELCANKNDYKNIVTKKLKDISKIEKQIIKNNSKAFKNERKNKKEEVNKYLGLNEELLKNLDELYKSLPLDKIKEQIYLEIGDNSKIYQYFSIIMSNYLYLKDVIEKKNIEDDVLKVQNKIKRLVYNPYSILINNANYGEIDKLPNMIVDKYKLLGVSINLDMLDAGSIESFINLIKTIVNYYYMENIKVNLDDVDYLLKAQKIIDSRDA